MAEKIGDLLLTFHQRDPHFPVRNQSLWETLMKIDGATLYFTQPNQLWQGFPVQRHIDSRWRIWLLGELTEPLDDLRQCISAPHLSNGNFLVVGHDNELKQWHILTNRMGTLHIYASSAGHQMTVGTFSPAVASAAAAKSLNWAALAGFFTFGFFPSNQSFWNIVELIGPASHLTLNKDGKRISERRYWQWDYQPSPDRPFDQSLAEFSEVFQIVINQMLNHRRTALPISGGLDSRCTVAALKPENNAHSVPFSYGYSDRSIETDIAIDVAKVRQLPIRTWTIQPYLFDQLPRVLSCLEGYQDLTQTRQAYVIDVLANDATHILAAHWGDVWLDDMGFTDYVGTPTDEELSEILIKKYSKRGSNLLLTLFRDQLPTETSSLLRAQIDEELKVFRAVDDLDFKVKLWKTQTWSHRWTLASLRMYQARLFPLLPFYDNRMVDFFLTLPSHHTKDRRFQIEYLKRFAPDLARIRWQPFDANLYEYIHFNTWLLPRRIYKKIKRTLSGKPTLQRNWEVQFLNNGSQKNLIQSICAPGLKLHDYAEKNDLEQAVDAFLKKPDSARGYEMSMLLTLSAWLERYG
ncbi:hypothetical protein KQH62_03355 [bacterium]|nr:hypothetical protein [bacterium]